MKRLVKSVPKSALIFLIITISGCTYYSSEVKKISEKYGMNIEEAQRCHSKFREKTETVLDFIEGNKNWFFGLFSEDCDDLIAQLATFGSYENLLAAKKNNWKFDDPAYKNYVMKRNKEMYENEITKQENELQENLKRMKSGTFVRDEDFGARWPFTVSQGYLDCIGGSAVFRSQMTEYGLNGVATSRGYHSIDPIWRNNSEIPGTKINIGGMIQLACSN